VRVRIHAAREDDEPVCVDAFAIGDRARRVDPGDALAFDRQIGEAGALGRDHRAAGDQDPLRHARDAAPATYGR
jgi:hypothetical protein